MLLDRLLPHVKEIVLYDQRMLTLSDHSKEILTNVNDFLTKTTVLQELDMSATPYDKHKFSGKHLSYLFKGLATNTSLQSIDLSHNELNCGDVQLLIDSLHPQSGVSFINVYHSLHDRHSNVSNFSKLLATATLRDIKLCYD